MNAPLVGVSGEATTAGLVCDEELEEAAFRDLGSTDPP